MVTSSLYGYDDVADRVIQHRQTSIKPIIVVEGRRDELFCSRVLEAGIEYFPAGNRERVLRTAEKLHKYNVSAVLCVVDRDFDDVVEEYQDAGLPVIAYDNGDLEAMLITTRALDDLVAEVCSAEKVAKYGGTGKVKEKIILEAAKIAAVRRRNAIDGLGLSFDKLELSKKVTIKLKPVQLIEVTELVICTALISVSQSRTVELRDLLIRMKAAETPMCPVTSSPLFSGKDALMILAAMMVRILANETHPEKLGKALQASLRLAAKPSSLSTTAWWMELHDRLSAF